LVGGLTLNKLLLVDTKGSGHHKNYAELVIEAAKEKYNDEIYFLAEFEMDDVNNIKLDFINHNNIFLRALLRFFWVWKVFKIAKEKDINHIHFLHLDSLIIISPLIYSLLFFENQFEITATLHHFKLDKLKPVFLRLLTKKFQKVVVHGEYLKKSLKAKSIDNVVNIEYPATHNYFPGKEKARELLNLSKDANILLSLGGTRENKGLDILLDALKYIKSEDFLLIIAGKEEYFSKEFILKKTVDYRDKVLLDLSFISDEKFSLYLEAGDAVILPYKKSFMGQSGPLTEGVNHNCFIISSNHGQIGSTVKNNDLGFIFEESKSKDLSKKVEKFLINKKEYMDHFRTNKRFDFKKVIRKKHFKNNYKKIL
jgi:glycosyltransferase involved in cell wall biosynthesis